MTVQDKYNRIIELLKTTDSNDLLIKECLSTTSAELTFSFFEKDSKVSKEHILDIYTTRARMEQDLRPESPFVVGYEELLPKLESTKLKYINICNILTEKGTFIIFTDYDYTTILGILHSKRTLSEVREKMRGSEYHSENVFINNILRN